jgi:lysophospholipase L1-like esterase
MKSLILAVLLIAVLCAGSMLSGCAGWRGEKIDVYKIEPNANSAVTPIPRQDDWWIKRHQAIVEHDKQDNPQIIFIGDSITHGWEDQGKKVWQKYYAGRNAVNMGFGGDRTQNVLWRLENGEIEGISPKLAIVMIGTNNSNGNDNTAKEISEGIIAICRQLRHKLPHTKILILAIFPRGEKPSAQREKNAEASKLASTIADNKWIYYLDINDKFLAMDGTLSRNIMPDFLHPNEKGYVIWAEAMEPTINKLLKD